MISRITIIVSFLVFILFLTLVPCIPAAAATTPPTISVDIVEMYVDRLVFHTRSSAAESIITNTTFYYSTDNVNWVAYETVDASPPAPGIAFSKVLSSSTVGQPFVGSTINMTIYYKASVSYQENGGTTTIETPVKSTRFNPIPSIAVSKTEYVDGVNFRITINANSSKIENANFYYKFPGETEVKVLLDSNYNTGENTYEYKIRFSGSVVYHSSVDYRDSQGHVWTYTTGNATAANRPPPEFSVNYLSSDTESVTVSADLSSLGNSIIDWYVAYQVPNQTLFKAYGTPSGTQKYTVILSGMPSDTLVNYWQVVIIQAIDGPQTLRTETKSAATKYWPEAYATAVDIDFDHASISCSIKANDNTILGSVLEYRLSGAADWKSAAGETSADFICSVSDLTPGKTLEYRLKITWQTTGGPRSTNSLTGSKPLYKCVTQTDYFQWQYYPEQNKGDLKVFADFVAYWVVPSDISHQDMGFVWSESATPLFGSANRISLGLINTPTSGLVLDTQLKGLVIGKTYYYSAYVVREDSSVYYGNVVKFITFMTDVGCFIPVISPGAVIYPTIATTPTTSATTATPSSTTSTGATSAATTNDSPTLSPPPTPSATETANPIITPTISPIMTPTISPMPSPTGTFNTTTTADAVISPEPTAVLDPENGGKANGSWWILLIAGVAALGIAAGVIVLVKKKR